MATPAKIRIEIPEQGVNLSLAKDEAQKFLGAEIEFYNRLHALLDGPFVINNANYGNIRIHATAVGRLQAITKALGQDDTAPLKEYVEFARALHVVVGQGVVGKRVESLIAEGAKDDAKWIMYLLSRKWMSQSEQLAPFRAAIFGNPALGSFSDVVSAAQARKDSSEARQKSDVAAHKLDQYIDEKSALFAQLEDTYRRKLILDEPAISWQRIAEQKTSAWRRWLVVFAGLVIGPLALAVLFWSDFTTAVASLTTTTSGGLALSGVAAISVPALLYAWLLKNVGRVFIQNLNLADDAAHRRALAITYLGLAENPKLKITEQDRALILNALFRPVPPHSGDEGPPAGLLELIRKP